MLDADALAAIRELADPYFVTDIYVYRPGFSQPDVSEPFEGYDLGDDEYDEPTLEGEGDLVGPATVWFVSQLQGQTATVRDAQLGIVDRHIVRARVGTDIRTHDRLMVRDSGRVYQVVDTNADDSWPEMMKMIVRRQE